jgi:hypothetical protein
MEFEPEPIRKSPEQIKKDRATFDIDLIFKEIEQRKMLVVRNKNLIESTMIPPSLSVGSLFTQEPQKEKGKI